MESEKSKNVLVIRAITALIRKIDPKFTFPTPMYYQNGVKFGLEKLNELFGSEMSDMRITDYLTYQVYRNRKAIAEYKWMVQWLFSDSYIERYKQQFMSSEGKAGMRYYIDQWLSEFGIDREIIAKSLSNKQSPAKDYKESDYEEPIKQRFHNTEAGYILCMQTTGWNPLSPSCVSCIYADKCKEQTEKRFPELYKVRTQSK